MLPKRVPLMLLAALACLNFLLRYPSTSHELGVDSFVWHGMATSLKQHGVALWVLNPLSYFGLYPLSHPSGSPFLLAAFSLLSNGSIEGAVVYLDMVVALISMLAGFILGREFTHSDSFALTTSLVLSLTPELITALTWQVPTRVLFTVLLPLLLWGLIRLAHRPSKNIAIVLGATFFVMMSFHRLTIFVSLIGFAYVVTGILLTALRTLRVRSPQIFLRRRFIRWAPLVSVIAVVGVSFGTLASTDVLSEYSSGALISGNSPAIQFANLGISLARNSGILLPLAVLGIAGVVLRRNKSYADPFVVVALLAFLPMLFLRQYTGYYTIPFTSLFIVFGLFVLLKRIRSSKRRAFAIAATAAFVLVSSVSISSYDLALVSHMANGSYNVAQYLRYDTAGTVITNEGLTGSRVHAISGIPYLPVGGATTAFQSPELLMFGFVDRSRVAGQIVSIPLNHLSVDADSPFELLDVQAEADWVGLLQAPVGAIPASYANYQVRYLLEVRAYPGEFTAYGNLYPAILLQTASVERYAVYQDSLSTIYFLG